MVALSLFIFVLRNARFDTEKERNIPRRKTARKNRACGIRFFSNALMFHRRNPAVPVLWCLSTFSPVYIITNAKKKSKCTSVLFFTFFSLFFYMRSHRKKIQATPKRRLKFRFYFASLETPVAIAACATAFATDSCARLSYA